jgi:hypothetical protein
MEEELDNDAVRHQFNLNSKFFTKEALEGFEDLIIGNVSHTVRYVRVDDLGTSNLTLSCVMMVTVVEAV